jgi:flavin reductase (DIM6/NTAB) family NADH-FMN oxidoreductase RutF
MTDPHRHFDFAALGPRDRYKLLIGTVIPRPIALVTTRGRDGRANAGPFSFFNVLTHDPPVLAIGIENHADQTMKDTARNIRETGEFTVHICDNALVEQMEICAIKFGPEVDELSVAGLETAPGLNVRAPRILAAPAALECRRLMTLELGHAREIVLGEVVGLFVRDALVDPATLYVDQIGMDAVGRLGGHLYANQREQFEIVTPTPAQWASGHRPTRTGEG